MPDEPAGPASPPPRSGDSRGTVAGTVVTAGGGAPATHAGPTAEASPAAAARPGPDAQRSPAVRVSAYVYPGWHPVPERDAAFHPGFTEWELLAACRPRFPGHEQPHVPLLGTYDDRDPVEVGRRIALARSFGVHAFTYGVFWCRGKRIFEDALDRGFLGSEEGRRTPFAVLWANRMPRRVLPVARADVPVIDPARTVPSDEDDFVRFVTLLAERYFARPNYLTAGGLPYWSIFDTSFFLRELGLAGAARAIAAARRRVRDLGLPGFHLAAIEPASDLAPRIRDVGFDSVTHYVHLPRWNGPSIQDYAEEAAARAAERTAIARVTGLPYTPSVSPGWDASPRGADFGPTRPDKYPWAPVVVGATPDRFRDALVAAVRYARTAASPGDDVPLVHIASLNEWTEGHYLEPDTRHGHARLEAVRDATTR